MSLPTGTYYFVTIATAESLTCPPKLNTFFQKAFPDQCFAVHEFGESGKKHIHLVGLSERRQDKIRSSILSLLKQLDISMDPSIAVKVLPCPNPRYQIGYLQKEEKREVFISNGFAVESLAAMASEYLQNPKRTKEVKQTGKLSVDKLAQLCIEAHCTELQDIKAFFKEKQASGEISFSTYQKINCKKFFAYVTSTFNDFDTL